MSQPLPAGAYTLPPFIPAELQVLHSELLARLRADAEAAGPAFNTILELLIERIAFNYIVLKYKELAEVGSDQGFVHERNQREFNTFWLSMTHEYNKLVAISVGPDEMRHWLLTRVNEALQSVLGSLHEDIAEPLRQQFHASFVEAGI